jgi:hypothetical protein
VPKPLQLEEHLVLSRVPSRALIVQAAKAATALVARRAWISDEVLAELAPSRRVPRLAGAVISIPARAAPVPDSHPSVGDAAR